MLSSITPSPSQITEIFGPYGDDFGEPANLNFAAPAALEFFAGDPLQLRYRAPRSLGAATCASGECERAQWDTATSRSLKRLSISSSMLLAA